MKWLHFLLLQLLKFQNHRRDLLLLLAVIHNQSSHLKKCVLLLLRGFHRHLFFIVGKVLHPEPLLTIVMPVTAPAEYVAETFKPKSPAAGKTNIEGADV